MLGDVLRGTPSGVLLVVALMIGGGSAILLDAIGTLLHI